MKNLTLLFLFLIISCSSPILEIDIEDKPVAERKPLFTKRVNLISDSWTQDQELMQYPTLILLTINDSETNLYTHYQPDPVRSCFWKQDFILTPEWDRGDYYGTMTATQSETKLEILEDNHEILNGVWVHSWRLAKFVLINDRIIYTLEDSSGYIRPMGEYKPLNFDINNIPICERY